MWHAQCLTWGIRGPDPSGLAGRPKWRPAIPLATSIATPSVALLSGAPSFSTRIGAKAMMTRRQILSGSAATLAASFAVKGAVGEENRRLRRALLPLEHASRARVKSHIP